MTLIELQKVLGERIELANKKELTTCCASDEFTIQPWLHKLTHWMPLPEPPKEGDK